MRHPYADFVHKVAKPARYLGGEFNQVRKEDWDVSLCLAFPDIYDIGMSHLGTKILYSLLNKHDRIACERAFTPWPDMEMELRARQLPLVSLENHRPLRDFDVVGISLQYEMTYTNVLTLLDLAGIPLRAADRGAEDPLVLGGGPTATHPEPVAPFFDLFLVGEAEEVLPEILLHYGRLRAAGGDRERHLLELVRTHDGLYAPGLYEVEEEELTGALVVGRPRFEGVPLRVERVWVDEIDRFPFPDDFPVPVAEAVFDRMSIEIARGCTEGCRFCQAGMIYRPVRERGPTQVIDTVMSAIRKGGFDEVSLTSLSTADYSCVSPLIKEMAERLKDQQVSLSVSSLRAYGMDDNTLDDIKSIRATGLTFAPEAGTQRMRDVVNKNITDDDMMETARRVFSRGWNRMKLYFMIGLPTETDEDVEGIVLTGVRARQVGRQVRNGADVTVNVSVSSHVPKPHTPFQWAAMDTPPEVERKQTILRTLARDHRIPVKYHSARISFLECIAARGDRRVADTIQLAWEKGCRFDGWDELLNYGAWEEAIRETGLVLERYLDTIPVDARLPWDHISVTLEDGFLLKEYRKSVAGRLSPPCGKPFREQVHHTNLADARAETRRLICYDCGVACDMSRMRSERIEFLESMGAEEPRPPAPAPAPVPTGRRGKRQPPPAVEQPPGTRYRFAYTKLGAERLAGHLDLIRSLPRVFRRAQIPVNYSQGYHPKPLFSFGPALSLGTAALREYFDVVLGVDVPAEQLEERLRRAAPEGLCFVGARRLSPGEPKLDRLTAWADYVVSLPASIETAELSSGLESFAEAEAWPMVRRTRKGDKTLDLVPAVEAVELLGPISWDPRLQLPENTPQLGLTLRLDLGWMARPVEIVEAIVGRPVEPLATARLGCWGVVSGERVDLIDGKVVDSPFFAHAY